VSAWQSAGGDGPAEGITSFIAPLPSADIVNLCYYDGDFTGIPQAPNASPPDYTRILLLVTADHGYMLDAAGFAVSPGARYQVLPIAGPRGST